MGSLGSLTQILGWCTVINFGLLMISFLSVMVTGDWGVGLYVSMFALAEEDVRPLWISVLLQWEILIIVFNLVPYIALKLVAGAEKGQPVDA